MKKIVVSLNTASEQIVNLQQQGYEVVFTECDESNTCTCQDCVQFGLIKHPEEC